MYRYLEVLEELRRAPRRWLVTGGAGFIGSHLAEMLLRIGQAVTVLDDFSTGTAANLEAVRGGVGVRAARRLAVVDGDIRQPDVCLRATREVDAILHQAGRGSVPRSIRQPAETNAVNVTGFVNIVEAARAAGVRRLVYASSSSVYGDHPALPKSEDAVGRPLSPYAASKYCDEVYAAAFASCYGLELVGLRYFNVFGARQRPDGPYAAVIPRWFEALLRGTPLEIYGDGETSRDFCYVANVVQANILAATTQRPEALGHVYNVAFGERTTLNELCAMMREQAARVRPEAADARPVYSGFRAGDVRHSIADISKARALLGYEPTHSVAEGLGEVAAWYAASLGLSPPAEPSVAAADAEAADAEATDAEAATASGGGP